MPASNTTMRATHASGTLVATNVVVKVTTRRGRGFRVRVMNTGGTNPMEISFNSGRHWYPIAAGTATAPGEFADDVAFHFFYLRSALGTTYSALIFEG